MAVVYCPRTHAWFAHPRYPLEKMLAAWGDLALGTDSRASSPDLSLLAEMRHVAREFPAISRAAILGLGTRGGRGPGAGRSNRRPGARQADQSGRGRLAGRGRGRSARTALGCRRRGGRNVGRRKARLLRHASESMRGLHGRLKACACLAATALWAVWRRNRA